MHPEIRRKDRTMSMEESIALLQEGEYGIMASVGSEGLPLATPLSYVYIDNAIYFHCANVGHKLDNMRHQPQVCFTVVADTQPVYDQSFVTYYRSAMAFGTATIISNQEERIQALKLLCEKYLPAHMDRFEENIERYNAITTIVRIDIAHISGKAKKQA